MEFDSDKFDELVSQHLFGLGYKQRPVPVKGGHWEASARYWFRYFWTQVPGRGKVKKCYRVNDDGTVERLA